MDDFFEMSYCDCLEYFVWGYEWNYFDGLMGIMV